MSDVQKDHQTGDPIFLVHKHPLESAWHEGHVQREDRQKELSGEHVPHPRRLGGQASPHSLLWLVGKWVFAIKWYARREPTNGELGSRGGLSKQIDIWRNKAREPLLSQGSGLCWPCFPSHTGSGGEERWRAVNKHRPSPKPSPPTFQSVAPQNWEWGWEMPWLGMGFYWPKLNFHVAAVTTSLANKELMRKGTFLCTGDRDPYGPLSLPVLRLAPLHPSFWSRCCCQSKSSNMQIRSVTWPFGIVQGPINFCQLQPRVLTDALQVFNQDSNMLRLSSYRKRPQTADGQSSFCGYPFYTFKSVKQ